MEVEKPTILGMVKSLGGAAIDQIVHTAKTGKGLASMETLALRIGTCKGCENFIRGNHPRCSKCRCLLTPKTKLAAMECPIGKWRAESTS